MSARVDVNLTWIAPGRVGGSEQYLTRQLHGLLDVAADEFDVRLLCQPGLPAAHPSLVARTDVVVLPLERDSAAARIVAEHTWLAARTRGAALVHHGGGTTPMVGARPIVLTIHDLQYLETPQHFSPTRLRYLRWMLPRSVARAAIVAVPSEFVRTTVVAAFDVAPDRVVVVPHGIPPYPRPDSAATDAAHARHGVDGDYVIYPAITHPHKGHAVLVDLLAATGGADHPLRDLVLVLTGGAGPAEDDLRRRIDAAGVGHRVVRTGFVSNADRNALLAGARALVFPSEYEGFGAPLVEAMAFGVPVVASAHPAVVEVCGGAATIVGEATGEAWAGALEAVLVEPGPSIGAGARRRADFTFAASGRALAGAYRRAIGAGA